MNEQFKKLSKEKQLRIINAGFEVFGKNEYKKASTDEIATKAGISKGLLFYYFKNKKSFYLYLYDYSFKLITQNVVDDNFDKITDFFELCEYAAEKKYRLMKEMPYVMNFVTRAFYSQKEDVSDTLNTKMHATSRQIYKMYFMNVNFSKFKDLIEPSEILEMLTYMADGYLHDVQRKSKEINLDEIMDKYQKWTKMLKSISYKEKYI